MASDNNLQISNLEQETAFLIGAQIRGEKQVLSLNESLKELAMLADTAGLKVLGQATQMIHHVDAATYIGSGKVQEVLEQVKELAAKTVIFTPSSA
jgi:GTP-binding protein HflX